MQRHLTRYGSCIVAVSAFLIFGTGCKTPPHKPQILNSRVPPTPMQAPPLNSRQAVEVPMAPVNPRPGVTVTPQPVPASPGAPGAVLVPGAPGAAAPQQYSPQAQQYVPQPQPGAGQQYQGPALQPPANSQQYDPRQVPQTPQPRRQDFGDGPLAPPNLQGSGDYQQGYREPTRSAYPEADPNLPYANLPPEVIEYLERQRQNRSARPNTSGQPAPRAGSGRPVLAPQSWQGSDDLWRPISQ